MANRHGELQTMLQSLKLTTMASTCSEIALKAAKEGLSHEAFLYELARLECEQRQSRRLERRLQQSGLPREKTFRTLQLERLGMPLRLHIGGLPLSQPPSSHSVPHRALAWTARRSWPGPGSGYSWSANSIFPAPVNLGARAVRVMSPEFTT